MKYVTTFSCIKIGIKILNKVFPFFSRSDSDFHQGHINSINYAKYFNADNELQ